ncbi:MAG: DUF885 domain-containing protein [Cytophagaceae bacterium]|nr:DUF885 domain-containing protein [Cytophagaceae bacterium]
MDRLKYFGLGFFCLFITGCEEKTEYTEQEIAEQSRKFNEWLDAEFEEEVAHSPMFQTNLGRKTDYGKWDDISSDAMTASLERNKERLKYLRQEVDTLALNEGARLSYKLYRLNVENGIEDYEYRFYDYPVNQMFGLHAEVPAFLINKHKIDNVADAKAYISRLKGIRPLFTELVNQLSIRESNQIIPPKFVLVRVLEDSRNILKGKPFEKSMVRTPLLEDFVAKLDELEIPESEKASLVTEAENALLEDVKPAYEELITFIEDQQQRATTDDGAWKFPHGDEYYRNQLARATTTTMTADEIHQFGLDEVARIHREMEQIMKQVGFDGSLQDFFQFMRTDERFYYEDTDAGREEYLAKAKKIIDDMRGRLDELFITKPKADIVVKRVEPFREKSAGKAFYNQPAPDGSRPGIYYANLYDIKAMPTYQMESLAYHEGIPGHHMQIAIAQELKDIPQFRKFTFYTPYVEGWGLYCELVPKEMGLYKDPYSDFGRLAAELWRACRLVVDTGIHDKKWTREECISYYMENTPNAESDCIKMVERHIVMPGQATAYKIGMQKILDLRKKAKESLGEDFDIREFHDVILTKGAVPLSILEDLVNQYISLKGK